MRRAEHSIWRLAVGEPVGDPPLVLGNQLFQVLPSGKILLIALDSGELQSTVNLGRPLARTPVHDESGQHLYVLGRQDCLFVLARDPLSCVSVVYLGHLDGSIPCSPAMLGRFLVVPENDSLADGRWHILVVDEDGVKVKPVQEVEVSGWTWSRPATSGSIVWATGDQGGYEAFSVGDYAEQVAVSIGGPARRPTRRRRARLSRWRGRTGICGSRRGIRGGSSSTPSTARSTPRRRWRNPGPRWLPFRRRADSWS